MMDWYSLRVISGKEKKIRDSLLLEVEREGYSAKVDQVFVHRRISWKCAMVKRG